MIETKVVQLPGGPASISGRADDGYFQNAENHAKEMFSLSALAKAHAGGGAILDVGGNIGLSCMAIARACPDNKVFVFEPSPRSAELLRNNLRENGLLNVEVIQAAASDRHGVLSLNEGQTSGFSHIVTQAHLGGHNADRTEVPVVVIDDLIKDAVSFVKIDVEGHEPNVLAGMRMIMNQSRPLVYMEFNAWCLSAFGCHNIGAMARTLFDLFDVSAVDADGKSSPIGVNAIGFVYSVLVNLKFGDIAIRLKPGKRAPSLEELTLPHAAYEELTRLRSQSAPS